MTASSRNALLSLQNTQALMNKTQGRLTSGLKVSSAIDNAVSYFAAKGINDRASDFSDRKDEIDQGISSLKTAVNGTSTADGILKQMKGLVNSARTADTATKTSLTEQFNNLSKQLNSALTDASYQGLNMVNGSAASLTINFSQGTAASLTVNSQNLNVSALITAGGAASDGAVLQNILQNVGFTGTGGFSALDGTVSNVTELLDGVSSKIDSAISSVRSAAASLGGNITFLNLRLDFTKNYINTLQEGSDKLVLADLSEETSSLLALQTRQQIGTQSLSIASQQQSSILSLLR